MKMKKICSNLMLLVFALAGLGLVFYPFIGYWFGQQEQSYIVQKYEEAVTDMDPETLAREWQRAGMYNQQLLGVRVTDPFTEDTGIADPEYLSYLAVLNLDGSSIMSYLSIPKIGVNLPVYHGTSEAVLQQGAGHLEGTALPVGGAGTHSVLTGHSGLSRTKMFTDLPEMEIGDLFFITTLDQVLAYQVDQIRVVLPDDTSEIVPKEGRDYVTLLTCTPYGINSHRLLVRGVRTDYTPEEVQEVMSRADTVLGFEEVLLFAGIAALVIIALLSFVYVRAKKKHAGRY